MVARRTLLISAAATVALAAAAGFVATMAQEPIQEAPHGMKPMTTISITMGEDRISATLDDTPTAQAFAALLPLELELSDYHGIEKVADLPRALTKDGAPESYDPSIGDITYYAPWGNLAIFYEDFPEARGLIRLGEIKGSIKPLLRDDAFKVRIEAAQ